MKTHPFTIPSGYFENLPAAIQARIGQASPLTTYQRQQVFLVPASYFDELPTKIQATINRLEGNIFEVPAEYFNELPSHIQEKISPTLPAQRIEEVMTVPHQYFENLEHHILRKVNQSKKIQASPLHSPALKWGFATSFVAIMLFFGLYIYSNKPKKENLWTRNTIDTHKKETFDNKPKEITEQNIVASKESKQEIIAQAVQNYTTNPYTSTQPIEQENTLAKYLETADNDTEEAIELLAENEEAAAGDDMEEWHETHEELLHKITEEEIASLPQLLKK